MTVVEEIRKMLESIRITSAGDPSRDINRVLSIDYIPDIESLQNDSSETNIKAEKQVQNTVERVKSFDEGPVGKIQDLTTAQVGNITAFARNPFQFMVSSVFKRFTKGVGIALLATIIFEAVKTILLELFKPGRAFDTQFRERIDQQVSVFLERREQQELRQQYKQVITTTIGGLRSDRLAGNIGGNFYNPDRIPVGFLDTRRVSDHNHAAQDIRIRSFQDVGAGAARSRRR